MQAFQMNQNVYFSLFFGIKFIDFLLKKMMGTNLKLSKLKPLWVNNYDYCICIFFYIYIYIEGTWFNIKVEEI